MWKQSAPFHTEPEPSGVDDRIINHDDTISFIRTPLCRLYLYIRAVYSAHTYTYIFIYVMYVYIYIYIYARIYIYLDRCV